MPKPAVISSSLGQRASVAAFMLLMLGVSTLLASGASYRPSVAASFQGLSWTLPADWAVQESGTGPFGPWRRFVNTRRSAMEMTVFDLGPMPQGAPLAEPANRELWFRLWFRLSTSSVLPDDANLQQTEVGSLDVIHWSGFTQGRLPMGPKAVLGYDTTAIVIDGDRHYWALRLRDRNYRHEDPRERSPAHRALFDSVMETLRAAPPS